MYPSLKITFLGTGTSSGVPMIGCECAVCSSSDKKDKRLRSSILVQTASTTIVIDAGPDFRYQMLRAGVKQLDAILFTHPHKDHVAGLDDVRAFNYLSGLPMQVFANEMTQDVLIREFPYAFAETRYPGVPEIQLNNINNETFIVGDMEIQPIEVWHHKMPVLGFRFGDFSYITDANKIEPFEKLKISGGKIIVLNALRKEKHISHFTLEEGIALGLELENAETYFTHISHQLGKHAIVENELPDNFYLAYDELQLEL